MKQTTRTKRCAFSAKERLLAAGVRLFLSRPHSAVTTRLVAGEARVNHALIAYHYGGMAQLMEAVVARCLSDLREQLLPEIESFQESMNQADVATLHERFVASFTEIIQVLQGGKSAALLRAVSSPDARFASDVYPRFTEMIAEPLFLAFTTFVAKAKALPANTLEVAVLAQLLLSQSMAFFRGGVLVKKHLGVAALGKEQQNDVVRIIVATMLRSVDG